MSHTQIHYITKYEFFRKLQKLPFIAEIWLFGSRARKTGANRTDIDIAVICLPNTSEEEWRQVP